MKSIYLATPYWHEDPSIRQHRFEYCSTFAGELMKDNKIVFSPISHNHPIAVRMGDNQDHDFWLKQDFYWLDKCDELYVLMLNGWEKSYGVQQEIYYALKHKKPITMVEGINNYVKR